jgi:hypothetical protein
MSEPKWTPGPWRKIRLVTTLNELRAAGACVGSYKKLLTALGGTSADHDAPLNILTILKHNGVQDALWAMRLCKESKRVARFMAADFAEDVLPIFEAKYPKDQRPRKAIEAARKLGSSADAAYAAADAAAAAAAYAAADAAYAAAAAAAAADAAYAAAYAAADAAYAAADAAYAAAAAAYAAADAAADPNLRKQQMEAARASACQRQAEIMRRYLLEDSNV